MASSRSSKSRPQDTLCAQNKPSLLEDERPCEAELNKPICLSQALRYVEESSQDQKMFLAGLKLTREA